MTLDAVLRWLINGVPGAKTPVDVVARMCPDLVAAGIPVDRCEAFVRTLHPHIAGRSFLWPGQRAAVDVTERSFAELHAPQMEQFAVMQVFQRGKPVRVRCTPDSPHDDIAALARAGFTDWLGGPLTFLSGEVHAITFATRRAGGFSDADIAALEAVLQPLSRIAEIFALLRTATNLLDTYVGHDAGARILGGQIQRGETNSLRAVIWFSDLRGFTSLSSQLPPVEIIQTLNEVFDCQVPSIERRGGQVLKFMGDGMLAVFLCDDNNRAARCADAVAAAREAFSDLERLNHTRAQRGASPVRFGVALHVGDVAYGNIGGAGRLDFTCIGPAVNLAARLEPLTGKLGKNVVVSEEVARLLAQTSPAPMLEELGAFELKGVPEPARAFAL